jgi:hypothetical protein
VKKRSLLFIGTALVVVLLLVVFSLDTSKAKIDETKKIDYFKKTFNMQVSINNNKDKISKNAAYKIAEKLTRNFSSEATDVTIGHYFLKWDGLTPAALSKEAKEANPQLISGINNIPVWIVSYEGISMPVHGMPGNNLPSTQITTINVVIDASTGEPLFQFRG